MNSHQWIDALSDPAVSLAAYVWKKPPAEVWGILSRAIQNEELSNPIPLSEFQEYIRLHIPVVADSTNYKKLFEYYIERHGLQDGKEKILSAFNGDYRKATQRLSNFQFPSRPPQPHKPNVHFTPLTSSPTQPKYPLLEKLGEYIFKLFAFIFWIIFIAFYFYIFGNW